MRKDQQRAVKGLLPINGPQLGSAELEGIETVVKSGILTSPSPDGGPFVRRFEQMVCDYVGTEYAVAVNSGTAALHASLMALGIGAGDEVIVPPITFGATATSVLLVGARPVFADVDLDTLNIAPESVRRKIGKRTRAIVPVHLYGVPAEMDSLLGIGDEFGVTIIEDACQALGSEYKRRKVGGIGMLGCFSFYPGKVITTGEGGMITTNDEKLARKLRMIRTAGQEKGYDYIEAGSNFRMPEVAAAMGCAQMARLPEFLKRRRRNAAMLSERIADIDGISLPIDTADLRHNYYLYTIRLLKDIGKRDTIVERMRRLGIDTRSYYTVPLHQTPLYRRLGYSRQKLPTAKLVCKSTLSIPVNPVLDGEDMCFIADSLKAVLTGGGDFCESQSR
jgi:perosamine synthetase